MVINLCSQSLSQAHISLLSKGLKFVPTRENIDKGQLITDLKIWERRMRLQEYFYEDKEEQQNEYNKYKKQSQWTPNTGRDKWLDMYIQKVKDDIMTGLKRRFKMNVTREECEAMKDLLNDNSIIIRPADKGSGVVVFDTNDYVAKLEGEMKDNTTYNEVKTDKTKVIENKVKKIVNEMYKKGSITNDVKGYLISSGGSSGKLQGNPKLHKTNIPLRTIVNGRNHPTAKMAKLVESELKEHVTSLPSYIKDTTDFLSKINQIQEPLPDNTILFCMDVKSLYPSVPRDEARQAVERALNQRSDKSIPTTDVLTMMDTVLENNNFSFGDKHFIQKEGTAIGSHLGMNYASTYLGSWENELFQRATKLPLTYFRYVDDVWGLWSHGLNSLKEFHDLANKIHPRIQIELRYSTDQLEFLDVLTRIRNNALSTDLFTKPTDKHMYLHKESSHPESTKNAIPYGLGVRVKRICSEEDDYRQQRTEIAKQLGNRGYDVRSVEIELKKVDCKERNQLLNYKGEKESVTRVPLVLTFSRGLPNLGYILRKHMPTLYMSDKMKDVFPEPPVLAFKRDTNLQDILVHKKHNKVFFNQPNSCGPCGANRCALCPYLMSGETFTDYKGGIYKVRNNINCKSTNVVYAIYCKRCKNYIYVGETGDTLYQRQLLNLSRIRTEFSDPVAAHFYTDGHTMDDFSVMGLEKLNGDATYRKTIENLWKKKLRTFRPYGVNTKE